MPEPKKFKLLYLHIGAEKTGSTALQVSLRKQSDRLQGQDIAVLNSKTSKDDWKLFWSFFSLSTEIEDLKSNELAAIHQAKSFMFDKYIAHTNVIYWLDSSRTLSDKCTKCVLSSELFEANFRTPQQLVVLKKLLNSLADSTKIILYQRPFADKIISLYSTALRVGFPLTLNEFIELKSLDDHYFTPSKVEARWKEAFGSNNVIIRNYENLTNDVVSDFFLLLGLERPDQTLSMNIALSKTENFLLYKINQLFPNYHPPKLEYKPSPTGNFLRFLVSKSFLTRRNPDLTGIF